MPQKITLTTYIGDRKISYCNLLTGIAPERLMNKGLRQNLENVLWGEGPVDEIREQLKNLSRRTTGDATFNEESFQNEIESYIAHSDYAAPLEEDFKGEYRVVINVENI